jgi:hypothetical protein
MGSPDKGARPNWVVRPTFGEHAFFPSCLWGIIAEVDIVGALLVLLTLLDAKGAVLH